LCEFGKQTVANKIWHNHISMLSVQNHFMSTVGYL